MPTITIDNQQVPAPEGATILEAAQQLGITIPTLCHLPGRPAHTSCMVCLVKVDGREPLVPACGMPVREGMRVESETPEVQEARRVALELLLSDHLGDCLAPCHGICPARMNIPRMIRQIAAGQLREALLTVKADIALPAVLGRICPAPCEKGCRRAVRDEAVSICLLKRYVADADLASGQPYAAPCRPDSGKRVAIVGAGPAGLAAAYHLRQLGHRCTVLDDHDEPGGALCYGPAEAALPRTVLAAEIATIKQIGVEWRLGVRVGRDVPLARLREEFDAVFVAAGPTDAAAAEALGLPAGGPGLTIDNRTLATPLAGVFAGGDAVRTRRLAVRAVADGKGAAVSIDQYLAGGLVAGPESPFTVHVGKLKAGEIDRFLVGVSDRPKVKCNDLAAGYRDAEARAEAQRCLHCDCRKADRCRLREAAQTYGVRTNGYAALRRTFEHDVSHPAVVYESGKCIACGICITLASEAREELGLTFVGRGFDVRVAVPFQRGLAEGLARVAGACVAACPTGALAWRHD